MITQTTSTLTIEFEPQAQLIKVTPTVITLPAVVLPLLEVEQHYSHLRHPFRWYNNVAIAECSSMLRGRDGGGRDNRKDAGEAGALLRCQAEYAEIQAHRPAIRLECQRSLFGDAAAEADSFFLYEPLIQVADVEPHW
eukprot:g19546.t1